MKIKWQTIVKIRASLLLQWYVFEGSEKPYVKSSLGIDFGFLNQKIVSDGIFIDLNGWAKLEKALLLETENHEDFFKKFIDLCNKFSSNLIETSKKINRLKNFQSYNNKKLLEI